MLQSFRDNLKGTVAIILVGLFCIPLVLFGVDSLFSSNPSERTVAEVNGEGISEIELNRAILMQKRQLTAQFGGNLPEGFFSEERMREPVLQRLIDKTLLEQSAEKNGVMMSEQEIDRLIIESGQFETGGRFDSNFFVQAVRRMGFTPATYKAELAKDLAVNQYTQGIAAGGFVTPEEEKIAATLGKQTRDYTYITAPIANVLEKITLEEGATKAYYDEHSSEFMTQEQVVIEAIELSAQELVTDFEVSEEEIAQQFEQELAAFESSVEREAAHVLLDADDADALANVQKKLAEGGDFAEVAKEFSTDFGSKEQGGNLGFTQGDTFPEAFEAALAALEVGAVSEPVTTDAGVHIIKLLSMDEKQPPTLDEKRLEIIQALKQAEAESAFVTALEELKDVSYGADDLEAVASELGLDVWTSQPFAQTGGDERLSSMPKVIDSAFSDDVLEDGNTSEVLELDEETALVLRVKEHLKPKVKAFDVVSEEITNKLKREAADKTVAEKLAAWKKQLESGETFEALATANELEVKKATKAERRSSDAPAAVNAKAFTLALGTDGKQALSEASLSNGDGAILRLDAIYPGDLSKLENAEKTALVARLQQAWSASDMTSVQSDLKTSADIEQ